MGREIKRVPLDFDWPSGKVWEGYLRYNALDEDEIESADKDAFDPPKGDGWQVWETVSEGSPVSPVFATSEELTQWMIKEGYAEAGVRKFIEIGWSPSFVMFNRSLKSGVDALGDL